MRICFDLDNTLCAGKPYELAKPLPGAAELLRKLRSEGHTVIIYTARGMSTCAGDRGKVVATLGKITLDQLNRWDFAYDEIHFGKPGADIYIDDKALNVVDLDQVRERIEELTSLKTQYERLDLTINS